MVIENPNKQNLFEEFNSVRSFLLKAFCKKNGINENIQIDEFLSINEKMGFVKYKDQLWGYWVHGLGIQFVNIVNLTVIDFDVDSKQLDIHKYKQYLKSIGIDKENIEDYIADLNLE